MNPINQNRAYYDSVFLDACQSTSCLSKLIAEDKFQVNSSDSRGETPLLIAVREKSLAIATMLLDNGADPNGPQDKLLLSLNRAILKKDQEMVLLLLERGANVNTSGIIFAVQTGQIEMVRTLLSYGGRDLLMSNEISAFKCIMEFATPKSLEIVLVLLGWVIQISDSLGNDEKLLKLAKYSRFCIAILKNDLNYVVQSIDAGDYPRYYENPFGDWYGADDRTQPARLAVRFGNPDMIEAFVTANIDLEHVYLEAVSDGKLALMDRCEARPGFDPCFRTRIDGTALHEACEFNQLEAIKVLVTRHGLRFDDKDEDDRIPLQYLRDPDVWLCLLNTFSEIIDVNLKAGNGNNLLLASENYACEIYTYLLELGAYPRGENENQYCDIHSFCDRNPCQVIQHFQKMMLIDPKYVNGIVYPALQKNVNELAEFKNLNLYKYEIEVEKMKSFCISQGTTSMPPRSLYDFVYFGPNKVSRYSRNEVVLQIYEEHNQDFKNFLPHYGFLLNFQLRKGQVRYKNLELALEILCLAFGVRVPEDLGELIFGHFGNVTLEHFSKEMIPN